MLHDVSIQARAYVHGVQSGLTTAFSATVQMFKVPFLKSFFRIQLITLVFVSLSMFIGSYILTIPLRLCLWLLGLFVTVPFDVSHAHASMYWMLQPTVAMLICIFSFYNQIEDLFFSWLQHQQAEYASELRAIQPLTSGIRIRRTLLRLAQSLVFLSVLVCLRLVPVIGTLVPPVAEVFVMRKRVGMRRALILAAVCVIPTLADTVLLVLRTYLGTLGLCREYLDVYFSRVQLGAYQERRFLKRQESFILGFALPFAVGTALPVVGPVIYIIGSTASATLLLHLIDAESDAKLQSLDV